MKAGVLRITPLGRYLYNIGWNEMGERGMDDLLNFANFTWEMQEEVQFRGTMGMRNKDEDEDELLPQPRWHRKMTTRIGIFKRKTRPSRRYQSRALDKFTRRQDTAHVLWLTLVVTTSDSSKHHGKCRFRSVLSEVLGGQPCPSLARQIDGRSRHGHGWQSRNTIVPDG
jgi:hypothetical protein